MPIQQCSTTTTLDWDSLRRIMAEFKARQQEELRGWSRVIEQTTCSVCGRKPTLVNGNTLVVCPHLYKGIKNNSELCDKSDTPGLSPLSGISIVMFDDGPIRW